MVGAEGARRFSRRLALVVLALVLVPLLVETLAIDPRAVRELGEPGDVLAHLVLGASLPYTTAGVACAALAWAWSKRSAASASTAFVAPRARPRPLLLVAALGMAFAAALARMSLEDVLLPRRFSLSRSALRSKSHSEAGEHSEAAAP